MANEEQVKILEQGVEAWNKWIEGNNIEVDLQGAFLVNANLQGASLAEANLQEASLVNANLQGASLKGANLQKAALVEANLQGARLDGANLQGARLDEVNLQGASLKGANLQGARLDGANLTDENFIGPLVVDAIWRDVNLSVVDWSKIEVIGDEHLAKQRKNKKKESKNKYIRKIEYELATRANRQLSVALAEQGLNRDVARFAYNGQVCYRKYLWFSGSYLKWLSSFFLWALAGYGYRVGRAFVAYLIVIFGFGMLYWLSTKSAFIPSIVESINVFHGRGISTPVSEAVAKSDFLLAAAGCEATIGLIIEVIFIASLTQRFFGK